MALRGTLKDFGIADIFQLIGHQGKTGILAVRNRDQEVRIYFKDGSVVRSESSIRQKRDLLGGMLVRAEILTDAQLAEALDTQKKTLKRLGDILIARGALDLKTLRAFAKLQTTETIYQLFLWDAGTYEFSQAEVEIDEGAELIRSESILMEGFRQVDEWPLIRRKITGYGMTFEKLEDLDALTAKASHGEPSEEVDDLDFGDAFGEMDSGGSGDARMKNIGQNERIIYQLVIADRDVQKIIDLSRLGEFESCKALVALIEAGIVQAIPEGHRKPSADATVGGIHAKTGGPWVPAVTRGVLYLALAGAAVYGAWLLGLSQHAASQAARGLEGYVAADVQAALTNGQLGKLRHALEVYRAETGDYPAALSDLVAAQLLTSRDIQFPWRQPYFYSKQDSGYELLRPFY